MTKRSVDGTLGLQPRSRPPPGHRAQQVLAICADPRPTSRGGSARRTGSGHIDTSLRPGRPPWIAVEVATDPDAIDAGDAPHVFDAVGDHADRRRRQLDRLHAVEPRGCGAARRRCRRRGPSARKFHVAGTVILAACNSRRRDEVSSRRRHCAAARAGSRPARCARHVADAAGRGVTRSPAPSPTRSASAMVVGRGVRGGGPPASRGGSLSRTTSSPKRRRAINAAAAAAWPAESGRPVENLMRVGQRRAGGRRKARRSRARGDRASSSTPGSTYPPCRNAEGDPATAAQCAAARIVGGGPAAPTGRCRDSAADDVRRASSICSSCRRAYGPPPSRGECRPTRTAAEAAGAQPRDVSVAGVRCRRSRRPRRRGGRVVAHHRSTGVDGRQSGSCRAAGGVWHQLPRPQLGRSRQCQGWRFGLEESRRRLLRRWQNRDRAAQGQGEGVPAATAARGE